MLSTVHEAPTMVEQVSSGLLDVERKFEKKRLGFEANFDSVIEFQGIYCFTSSIGFNGFIGAEVQAQVIEWGTVTT